MELVRLGVAMANDWNSPPIILIASVVSSVVLTVLQLYFVYLTLLGSLPLWFPGVLPLAIYGLVEFVLLDTPRANPKKFLKFTPGTKFEKRWGERLIPVTIFIEHYMAGDVDFINDDVYGALQRHKEWLSYRVTPTLFVFIVKQFVPPQLAHCSSSFHDKKSMKKEIADHYDRSEDFFAAFLGPRMIYTCAMFTDDPEESLETAQDRKLDTLCKKIHLKKGHKMLDIGCGWGTLSRHAAKNFGASVTGVTLSEGGALYCRQANKREAVDDVTILECDYRDVPRPGITGVVKQGKTVDGVKTREVRGQVYDRITSIEMAEHVGIKNMHAYLSQVREMLSDDGIYLQQVAGIRQGANWEDVNWGLFMGRYIFPGADASTPLWWYINTLEQAGFEVRSVETIGVHYGRTLKHWYENFMRDHKSLKYPESLIRLWKFFLAWASLAGSKGVAACYQIVCNKNTNSYDRRVYYKETGKALVTP